MTAAENISAPAAEPAEPLHRGRIDGLDVLRGIVMVLMALDHTRDYLLTNSDAFDITDPAKSNLVLYFTRWVSNFCAPTFLLLAGLGPWLRRAQGVSPGALSGFLVSRGLWLILLELTVVGTGFSFHPGMLFPQVIWVIGASMILLAAFSRAPTGVVLAIGVAIIALHDLLDPIDARSFGAWAFPYQMLYSGPTPFAFGPIKGVLLYSLIAWTGIMFLGFGLGPIFKLPRVKRDLALTLLGLGMIATFVVLRVINGYGDFIPFVQQPTAAREVMAFLRVSKYPPTLDFTLATLGPMLMLLPWLDRWKGRAMEVLRTFGRVPFFFYILHIYLIHGLSAAYGMAHGLPFSAYTDLLNRPKDMGVSLPMVYLIWIGVVVVLYFPCRWFEGVRQRRHDWWLSYL
ncbi:MAG TPA: heparan-alpha-glucosaminide N-acetyltransferase domain-containing protein [Caulobacteraceae bacterium]|jgi:uncharacterized membrane protein